jgi:cob(I)alamin adenosyltransferase
MLSYEYLPKDEVLLALANRPKEKAVLVTGRRANDELIERTDSESDIQDSKHTFRAELGSVYLKRVYN